MTNWPCFSPERQRRSVAVTSIDRSARVRGLAMTAVRSFSTSSRPACGRPAAALGRQPPDGHRRTSLTLRSRPAATDALEGVALRSSTTIRAHRPFKHRMSSAPTGPLTGLVEQRRLARRANSGLRARRGDAMRSPRWPSVARGRGAPRHAVGGGGVRPAPCLSQRSRVAPRHDGGPRTNRG
jgi:hypothetical protein